MADDLTVRFAGDTSGLNKSIADARSTLANFAPQATGQAKGSLDALSAAFGQNAKRAQETTASWRENIATLADFAVIAKTAFDALETFADVQARSAGFVIKARVDIEKANFQADKDIVTGGLSAIGHLAQAASTEVQVAFGAAEQAVSRFAAYSHLAIGSFADQTTIMAVAAAGGLQALQNDLSITANVTREKMRQMDDDYRKTMDAIGKGGPSVNLLPNLDGDPLSARPPSDAAADTDFAHTEAIKGAEASIKSADDTLKGFLATLQEIPDTSKEAATSIEAALTTIPNYTTEANDALVDIISSIASTGDEAKETAKTITDAFADAEHGGTKLAAVLAKIEDPDQQFDYAKTLARSLSPQQAVAFFNAIKQGVDRQRAGLQEIDDDYERQQAKLGTIGRMIEGIVGNTLKEHATRQETITSLTEENSLLEEQSKLWTEIAKKTGEEKAFVEAIKASSTPTGKIDDLTKRQAALNSRPQKTLAEGNVSGDQLELAAKVAYLEARGEPEKGQEGVVNVMRNRLQSGNYGSDLTSVLMKNKQFANDPTALAGVDTSSDAYQQILEIVRKQFGANPNPDVTNGATHFLNPKTSTDRSWIDKMTNVTSNDALGQHKFGNDPGEAPVHSDSTEKQRREAVEQTNTALREQQAIQAGGTALEQHQAEVAERNLTAAKDDIAAAKEKVDLAKKAMDASSNGTPQEFGKAQNTYVQAQQELKDKEFARDQARNALDVAMDRDGSKKKLDDQLVGIAAKRALTVAGSAEDLALQKEAFEAVKGYNAQEAANAKETENEKFEATKSRLANERKLIEENQRSGSISPSTAAAQTKSTYTQEEAAAKQHTDALLAINTKYGTDSVQEMRKTTAEGVKEQLKLTTEQIAAAQKANAAMLASYDQEFEKIGSVVSSGFMGMLEHTSNFAKLSANVAKSITESFIQARVKSVADWAAGEAQKVVLTVLGQTQQTGAVTAGTAARTAAVGAGASAQGAVTLASITTSIQASAAEGFAGVAGFLSPILGPAAAGPAAAFQALISSVALPSFAVGHMNLPSDMIAQVHKGEMIVPAGPAAMMRAAMGGGGGSSGSAGGDTHYHYSPTVQAMDSRDTKRFFATKGRAAFLGMVEAARGGANLPKT